MKLATGNRRHLPAQRSQGGRRIDLRTPGELSRYFRDEVINTAEVQYVSR